MKLLTRFIQLPSHTIKIFGIITLMLMMACGRSTYCEIAPTPLTLGSAAPDFELPGVDGKIHKLSDYSASKVLVVVFLCNHCTESQLYENRIEKIADSYRNEGVSLVAIQSNNPDSLSESDLAYTDVGESLADMKTRVSLRHLSFPYLYDGDTQKVGRLYGPTVTPETFIFDRGRKLRYKGRIDDSVEESGVKEDFVRNAIEALLANKPINTAQTPPIGCSLRWLSKIDQAKTAKIDPEPIKLSLAGTTDLSKLRTNPTGKLLLVNFYATWCGPCVSEFPDLMATNRMYRDRPFALTTVSSNEPDEQPDVKKFLDKMHASTTNLLFATTDTYALQAAFDPNMGAAVPFTVLIAPNGDILFQQQGDLDMMALRRAILANLPDDKAHKGSQKYWSTTQ